MFRFTLAVPPCSPYERMRSIVSLHTLAVEKHGAGHQLGTTDMWQFGVLCVGYMQDAGVPTDRKSWMAQALLSQSMSLGRVVCCRTNHKQQQNWNKRRRHRSIIHIAVNDDMWHLATELVHWLKVVHSAQALEPAIQQSMLRGQFEPMAHQWLTQNVLYACCQPEKLWTVSRLGVKYHGDKWEKWMLAFLDFHCLTPGTFRGSSSMQEHVEQRQQQQQPPCVIDERVIESESSSSRPPPKFSCGQIVHHWWASWMCSPERAPQELKKKKRPEWYSAQITTLPQWEMGVYAGVEYTGWHYMAH